MFDIKKLIKNDIAFIDCSCLLAQAAKLLSVSDQWVLPVVNEYLEIIGIVTEKDVLAWLCSGKDRKAKAIDYMRTEFVTIDAGAEIAIIAYIFAEENYKEVPVVSDGILTGLITRSSVIKYLIDEKAAIKVQSK
jgi:predicted transcriptional regulator